MNRRIEEAVFVEAPARLHFGVLDLRGALGRWFGGIGAAAPAPTLLVSAVDAEALEVEGDDAPRASAFAAQVLQHYRLTRGARTRHWFTSAPRESSAASRKSSTTSIVRTHSAYTRRASITVSSSSSATCRSTSSFAPVG